MCAAQVKKISVLERDKRHQLMNDIKASRGRGSWRHAAAAQQGGAPTHAAQEQHCCALLAHTPRRPSLPMLLHPHPRRRRRAADRSTLSPTGSPRRCRTEFCKQQLWPILHYLVPLSPTSLGRFDPNLWSAYVRANMAFANKLVEVRRAVLGLLRCAVVCCDMLCWGVLCCAIR